MGAATVPTSVMVAAGATTVSVPVTTSAVPVSTAFTISATNGGKTQNAALEIRK